MSPATIREQWEHFFERYNRAKAAADPQALATDADFALVEAMLANPLVALDPSRALATAAGLDPVSLSCHLKHLFRVRYTQRAVPKFELNRWYADHEVAVLDPEFYRLSQERWQVHARLGFLRCDVEGSLRIDFSEVAGGASAYTAVVYRGVQTVASFGAQTGELVHDLELAPGTYFIGFRYYAEDDLLRCPEVLVDGRVRVAPTAEETADGFRRYLDEWMRYPESPVYFAQQYHIFYWLRFHSSDRPQLVERTFLPVANPETRWKYGALEGGQAIEMTADDALFDTYDVYLTFVSEMSLPVGRERVTTTTFRSAKIAVDGGYHLRFVARGAAPPNGFPEPDCTVVVTGR